MGPRMIRPTVLWVGLKTSANLQITPGLSTLWPPRETEVWYGQRFSGEVVNFVELLQVKLGQTRFLQLWEYIFRIFSETDGSGLGLCMAKSLKMTIFLEIFRPQNDKFLKKFDFFGREWFWIFWESLKMTNFWKFDLFDWDWFWTFFWMPQKWQISEKTWPFDSDWL